MKLEDQVVSLELAKKLKELGVRQESYFSWYEHTEPRNKFQIKCPWITTTHYTGPEKLLGSAFSVAELGEMLPLALYCKNKSKPFLYLRIETFGEPKKWRIQYMRKTDQGRMTEDRHPLTAIAEESEANARAKMLCFLIEQKIVKAK